MREEREIVPYRHEVLNKHNYLIGTKYKASNLENQITYLSMLKIQEHEYQKKGDGIYVSMSAAEIKDQIGNNSGSFYQRLKTVANDMTGNNIGVVNDEKESFEFITLINKATYSEGVFTIRFAIELQQYLVNVEKDYTQVPKEIAMSLKRPYSFPLYQILKKQCYYPKSYQGEKNYVFSVIIGLSELKLDMGLVNLKDSPEIKRALMEGKGTAEDYDRAIEKSKDKMFDTWAEFDRGCLRKTINEINEKTDIYVEYKKKTKSRGAKVYAVDFTVWLNGAEKDHKDSVKVMLDEDGHIKNNISEEERFMIYMTIAKIFEKYNFSFSDITVIAEAANYDKKRLKKAYDLLERAGNVSNVVGWVISCLRDEYQATGKTPVKADDEIIEKLRENGWNEERIEKFKKSAWMD